MTDESKSFWDGFFIALIIGIFAVMVIAMITSSISYNNGLERMEKYAVYHGYGEYTQIDRFLWKDEIEKENFLKDLEFFKRNEKKMKEMQQQGLQIPLNKIDPSQPF